MKRYIATGLIVFFIVAAIIMTVGFNFRGVEETQMEENCQPSTKSCGILYKVCCPVNNCHISIHGQVCDWGKQFQIIIQQQKLICNNAQKYLQKYISCQNIWDYKFKNVFNLIRVDKLHKQLKRSIFAQPHVLILSINSPGGPFFKKVLQYKRKIYQKYYKHFLCKTRYLSQQNPNILVCRRHGFEFSIDSFYPGFQIICQFSYQIDDYTLIGDFGYTYKALGFQDLMQKVGINIDIQGSGGSKVRLNPFTEYKEEDIKWIKNILISQQTEFRNIIIENKKKYAKVDLQSEFFDNSYLLSDDILKFKFVDEILNFDEFKFQNMKNYKVKNILRKKFYEIGVDDLYGYRGLKNTLMYEQIIKYCQSNKLLLWVNMLNSSRAQQKFDPLFNPSILANKFLEQYEHKQLSVQEKNMIDIQKIGMSPAQQKGLDLYYEALQLKKKGYQVNMDSIYQKQEKMLHKENLEYQYQIEN